MSNAPTNHVTRAAMYRQAARIVEMHDQQSCNTIHNLTGDWPEAGEYARLFSPKAISEESNAPCCEFSRHLYAEEIPITEKHDFRVIALCFMAAMVEAGDA